jgi:hypothetical protein
MKNLSGRTRTVIATCFVLLVSIIGMSFSSPKQEGIHAVEEPSSTNIVNQYLGKWEGTFIQRKSEYPMALTISRKESNQIEVHIEWPKWDSTTRGYGFITQIDDGYYASKCISWIEMEHIKKVRGILLYGRYIANLVNDNELKGIYILPHNLKQGGTFSLSKVQE